MVTTWLYGRCRARASRSATLYSRRSCSVTAPAAGHFGGNLLGDGALIEGLGALLRNQAHRLGQVFCTSRSPRFRARRSSRRSRWWRAICPCSFAPGAGSWPGFRSTGPLSPARWRCNHLVQRHGAPFLQGMLHARHGARHAHGVVGVERLAVDDVALVVQVHVARWL